MPLSQLIQPRPVSQRQRWHQPSERHEVAIIKACRPHRIGMRELHLRDALRSGEMIPRQDRFSRHVRAFSLYDPLITDSCGCIRAKRAPQHRWARAATEPEEATV